MSTHASLMMEEDDGEERLRKQKIEKLIDSIRSRRPRKKTMTVPSNQVKVKGTARHTKYKIRIGWQNYGKGGYHLVTAKTGGGIRTIEYSKDEPQNVKTLTELGKKLFFPDGESSLGHLNDFTVNLANYKGDPITEFRDLDGNECSFQKYLKAHGIYSSQFNVYIRTKSKCADTSLLHMSQETDQQDNECKVKSFRCNGGVPKKISLKYSKTNTSLYSNNDISINCYALKECFMLSGLPQEMEHEYSAIDDGFMVVSITINGETFIAKDDNAYKFPQYRHDIFNDTIIVHGPSEIFGLDQENNLILGLITTRHNEESARYYWFKDGEQIISGINMCIISVKQPGTYVAAIEIGDTFYISDPPVNVVQNKTTRFDSPSMTNQIPDVVVPDIAPPSADSFSVTPPILAESNIAQAPNVIEKSTSLVTTPTRLTNSSLTCTSVCGKTTFKCLSSLPVNIMQDKTTQVESPSVTNKVREVVLVTPPILNESDLAQAPHVVERSPSHVTTPTKLTNSLLTCTSVCGKTPSKSLSSLPVNIMQDKTTQVESPSVTNNVQDVVVPVTPPILTESDLAQAPNVVERSPSDVTTPTRLTNPSRTSDDSKTDSSYCIPFGNNNIKNEKGQQSERKISLNKRCSENSIDVPHCSKKASIVSPSIGESTNNEAFCSVPRIDSRDITIGNAIGQGAFGIVFKAEWLATPVAVKQIMVKRMKVFEKSLHRELQIHSRIRHPNIVQLMAYATEKNSLYLVSEYIEGHNLEEIVFGKEHEVECLHIRTKCFISKELLQAIAYLHNIRPVVVHRDIKPENVLVSSDLKVVKLCDMGLSKLKTMTTLITTLACKQAVQPGTPAYQAPELVLERKSATCESDIWSLSCTIVELYTEDQVWNLDSESEDDDDMAFVKSRMRQRQNPDGLKEFKKKDDIPGAIIDIISKGLSYEKDARPTAIEMLMVFKRI